MGATDPEDTSNASRREILDDHAHVRGLLGGLEEHLDRPVEPEAEWRSELQVTLSDLHRRLQRHFKSEEKGGVHERLMQEAPRLAHRLDELFADHPAILERLTGLLASLSEEGGASPLDVRALTDGTRQLIEQLSEHEASENEVMLDAYWDDLGGEGG